MNQSRVKRGQKYIDMLESFWEDLTIEAATLCTKLFLEALLRYALFIVDITK